MLPRLAPCHTNYRSLLFKVVHYIEKPRGFNVRMRVVEAVTDPIRTLSVTEICRRAGISRQTFYSYFESKYAIGSWYALHCDTFTLDLIGRALSWREGYERWYTIMERQKLLFANSSQSKFSDEGAAAVAENRIAAFRETFENRGLAFTDEYCYYAWMCASVERTAFSRWLKEGCAPPPADMARLTELCVPPLLHRALSL